jgi:hypothetical protein
MFYHGEMQRGVTASSSDEQRPRTVVVRTMRDGEVGLATLGGAVPVLFVLRTGDAVRQRLLDLLRGWSLGSGGSLDTISPSVVAARPAGAGPVRLGAHRAATVVEEVEAGERRLTRDDEARLIPLAAAGSSEAQGRLIDGYSELATVLALWLRPATMTTDRAVSLAQDELVAVARWPLGRDTILVTVTQRINDRLNRP